MKLLYFTSRREDEIDELLLPVRDDYTVTDVELAEDYLNEPELEAVYVLIPDEGFEHHLGPPELRGYVG